MASVEPFHYVRSALESAGVRYAVGGSWASTAYGDPRFTNDVDVLAEFVPESLERFLAILPAVFYVDAEEARRAVQAGRPFNAIHRATISKFDFFPASSFPLGAQELDRALTVHDSGLCTGPVFFVTAEDILLAKLWWFRSGGEVSEVQWRDIRGIVRGCASSLDSEYLALNAEVLGLRLLLDKALTLDV